MGLEQFLLDNPWVIFLIALWVLPWKGVALWRAAKKGDKKWFIFILIFNTLAILEILYIYVFGKEKVVEQAEN